MGGYQSRITKAGLLAVDCAICAVAMLAAFWLRLDTEGLLRILPSALQASALYAAACGVAFVYLRTYRGLWRGTSFDALLTLVVAAAVGMMSGLLLHFALSRADDLPRTVPFIAFVLTVAGLAGPRLLVRRWSETRNPLLVRRSAVDRLPVLVLGIGPRASAFVREVLADSDAPFRIVGLLSAEPNLEYRRLHNIDVLGEFRHLPHVVARLARGGTKPAKVVVAEDLDEVRMAELLELCASSGLSVGRAPKLLELNAGREADAVVPLSINDLLSRPEVRLNKARTEELIAGRRVLVTGAGGSIGSELVRQIAAMKPAVLTLLDASEYHLYEIDREIATAFPDLPRAAVICDVRDRERVRRRFAEAAPDFVFHAAALKHVPLMESQPCEAVLTNVGGTRNVIDAGAECEAAGIILVSTDKAVNPTNVMGATKRVAEIYAQSTDVDLARRGKATRVLTVRFGNVLGSAGSVVPLFKRQIEAGGPVTVTHPDIERFFMSIPEAVQLILEAMTRGHDSREALGRIYVLDMGKPIKIVDLARQMIRLSGKRPDIDVRIEFVGLRPGEKLFEEVVHDGEQVERSASDGLLVARARMVPIDYARQNVERLIQASAADRGGEALEMLAKLVPEGRLAGAETPLPRLAS